MTPREHNLQQLRLAIHERTGLKYENRALIKRAGQIVVDAEMGTLSDHDSRILAEFAISILKECI